MGKGEIKEYVCMSRCKGCAVQRRLRRRGAVAILPEHLRKACQSLYGMSTTHQHCASRAERKEFRDIPGVSSLK